MSWQKGILAVLGVVVLAAIGGLFWFWDKSAYHLDNSSSGSFLAAYQASLNKDYANAGRYYDAARRVNPGDLEILRETIRAHLVAGNMVSAGEAAEVLLTRESDNRRALILLAVASFKSKEYGKARDFLDRLKPGPMSALLGPNIRLWLAIAQNNADARADALKKLERTSAIGFISHMQAAQGFEIDGDIKQANRLYKMAVNGAGLNNLFFTLAYGGFLHRQGQLAQAEKVYTFYQSTHPRHPTIGAAKQALKDGDAAPLNHDSVIGMAGLFATIGEAMKVEGRHELALVYTNLAHYLDASDMRVVYQIAELLDKQDIWSEAENWYARIARDDTLFIEAQVRRADVLDNLGRTQAAIGGLLDVLDLEGENLPVLVAMGDLLRVHKRFQEAEAAYDRAIATIDKDTKGSWHIYFARGICRERLEDWQRAESDLQKARKLSGGDPHVLNYLGYSWIDQGVNLQEGLDIITQAVKKNPSNGSFVDSLGWAHYRLGNYAQALAYLERASTLVPRDAIVTNHLGDAMWRLGRKIEARYQWRKALAFGPEEKDRIKIEAKLVKGLKPVPPLKSGNKISRGDAEI